MSETISLSTSTFEKVVTYFSFYPPNDGGHIPWHPHRHPGGPVLRTIGPHPEPWRYLALAQTTVAYLAWLHDTASAVGATNATQLTLRMVADIESHGCGNDFRWVGLRFSHGVPHHPEPPDPPITTAHPVETLAFGVGLFLNGKGLGDSPLGPAIARAGVHIVEAGNEGLENIS